MSEPEPAPETSAELEQVERYEFRTEFPNSRYPPIVGDEPPPVGGGKGPDPVHVLAAAVGHCMSSTLFSTLERSHVPVTPIRTEVRTTVGRNSNGRRRVLKIDLTIRTAPLNAQDQERFDHAVSIFEDFCTVSGAIRTGIPISTLTEAPRVAATGAPEP